jgi:hypothetical protein
MTPQDFLELSTRLCTDLKNWIAEVHRDGELGEHQLSVLNSAIEIINQVTLQDVADKTET